MALAQIPVFLSQKSSTENGQFRHGRRAEISVDGPSRSPRCACARRVRGGLPSEPSLLELDPGLGSEFSSFDFQFQREYTIVRFAYPHRNSFDSQKFPSGDRHSGENPGILQSAGI